MKIKSFVLKMIDYNMVELNDTYIMFKRPGNKWELWNSVTDESEIISDLESHSLASALIEELEDIEFGVEGGRGASGTGANKYEWRNAAGRVGKTSGDLPSRMNNKIKTKTERDAIAAFRNKHGKSDKEHLIQIDGNGFVHTYSHGGKSNVGLPSRIHKGSTLVHNHPNNSSFSPADMLALAGTKAKSIVATHSGGYRKITKGTHFDTAGFTKAVATARKKGLRGKDSNAAVDNFLKRNQKKYGYKFENVKD